MKKTREIDDKYVTRETIQSSGKGFLVIFLADAYSVVAISDEPERQARLNLQRKWIKYIGLAEPATD